MRKLALVLCLLATSAYADENTVRRHSRAAVSLAGAMAASCMASFVNTKGITSFPVGDWRIDFCMCAGDQTTLMIDDSDYIQMEQNHSTNFYLPPSVKSDAFGQKLFSFCRGYVNSFNQNK
jgi:hypothetical protein